MKEERMRWSERVEHRHTLIRERQRREEEARERAMTAVKEREERLDKIRKTVSYKTFIPSSSTSSSLLSPTSTSSSSFSSSLLHLLYLISSSLLHYYSSLFPLQLSPSPSSSSFVYQVEVRASHDPLRLLQSTKVRERKRNKQSKILFSFSHIFSRRLRRRNSQQTLRPRLLNSPHNNRCLLYTVTVTTW